MKFVYEKPEFPTLDKQEENCWLLTNGLGGYMSTTAAFSVNRCDTGLLVSAETAPNFRVTLVHRLSERLRTETGEYFLSSQSFADGRAAEDGYRYLESFVFDGIPEWNYKAVNITVRRRCGMAYGENTSAVVYDIFNSGAKPCVLRITPSFLLNPKGEALYSPLALTMENEKVISDNRSVFVQSSGTVRTFPAENECLFYAYDERDGRAASGYTGRCCTFSVEVAPNESGTLKITFSTKQDAPSTTEIVRLCKERQKKLLYESVFSAPAANELSRSADAFLVKRESTNGMSIIAGYPFFGDWGRDTMIALPGCTLATKRYEDAKSIMRTFFAYEKDGLVPNVT